MATSAGALVLLDPYHPRCAGCATARCAFDTLVSVPCWEFQREHFRGISHPVLIEWGVTVVERVVPIYEGHVTPEGICDPRQLVELVRRWVSCPCVDHAKALESTHHPLREEVRRIDGTPTPLSEVAIAAAWVGYAVNHAEDAPTAGHVASACAIGAVYWDRALREQEGGVGETEALRLGHLEVIDEQHWQMRSLAALLDPGGVH